MATAYIPAKSTQHVADKQPHINNSSGAAPLHVRYDLQGIKLSCNDRHLPEASTAVCAVQQHKHDIQYVLPMTTAVLSLSDKAV